MDVRSLGHGDTGGRRIHLKGVRLVRLRLSRHRLPIERPATGREGLRFDDLRLQAGDEGYDLATLWLWNCECIQGCRQAVHEGRIVVLGDPHPGVR